MTLKKEKNQAVVKLSVKFATHEYFDQPSEINGIFDKLNDSLQCNVLTVVKNWRKLALTVCLFQTLILMCV